MLKNGIKGKGGWEIDMKSRGNTTEENAGNKIIMERVRGMMLEIRNGSEQS